jgi:hypothetical protein
MELLSKNNPNILELLNTPASSIIYKHPLLEEIKPEYILSKVCKDTFGNFALSQIKKAKGLNKKIVNPVSSERKSVLSFCYVSYDQGAIPVIQFLEINGWNQDNCGLVNIPHMKDVYGLYYEEEKIYSGIIKGPDSNEVCLSSIPKDKKQQCLLYFNRDGYSKYCKDYKDYWDWVNKRNEARYENTKSHGKNYDAKNMMHVFRLLDMAIEIGLEKRVNVKRPNREFLLDIKAGKFDYHDLIKMADEKYLQLEEVYKNSNLPEFPNIQLINKLTFQLREKFYSSGF